MSVQFINIESHKMDSFNIIKYVYSQQPTDNIEIDGKWVLFADALKDNVSMILNYVISYSKTNIF